MFVVITQNLLMNLLGYLFDMENKRTYFHLCLANKLYLYVFLNNIFLFKFFIGFKILILQNYMYGAMFYHASNEVMDKTFNLIIILWYYKSYRVRLTKFSIILRRI